MQFEAAENAISKTKKRISIDAWVDEMRYVKTKSMMQKMKREAHSQHRNIIIQGAVVYVGRSIPRAQPSAAAIEAGTCGRRRMG